jgi:hypothetical protein
VKDRDEAEDFPKTADAPGPINDIPPTIDPMGVLAESASEGVKSLIDAGWTFSLRKDVARTFGKMETDEEGKPFQREIETLVAVHVTLRPPTAQ